MWPEAMPGLSHHFSVSRAHTARQAGVEVRAYPDIALLNRVGALNPSGRRATGHADGQHQRA